MRGRKIYGEYKIATCPFCARNAIARNVQGIPVCEGHRNESIAAMRCMCGRDVEVIVGKWGPYGRCERCGNLSWSKLTSMNTMSAPRADVSFATQRKAEASTQPREITVRSDEVDFL